MVNDHIKYSSTQRRLDTQKALDKMFTVIAYLKYQKTHTTF